jgi:hypothetical protein
MTKKDYVALARALNGAYKGALTHGNKDQAGGVLLAALEVADTLGAERSQFDRGRFLDAVRKGVTP